MIARNSKVTIAVLILVFAAFTGGCVYYNTFYNAKKAFNAAEGARKKQGRLASGRSAAGGGQYRVAIEKSQKVLDEYPSSKYYDDALFVNGVSHYWTEDYGKAEKRFRELIANFPESQYAKEANLYLAKSKLKLKDVQEAMTLFGEIYEDSKDKQIKADAALALGEYFWEEKDYEKADDYFKSLVDSLGNEEEKTVAQMYIADGYFNRFKYKQAMEAYKDILGYADVSSENKYKAKYRIGECLYFLNDIEGGMKYFEDLAGDDLYYDSLPAVKLMIAQGYEWDGDNILAQSVYEDIALESPRSVHGSYANYMLGLIYQYDYEDYQKAKEYYDAAKAAGRNSDVFDDALERSANIGKLEEYLNAVHNLDSTSSQEEVDRAAETQYLLSELYLLEMERPDSALTEYQFILENFPDAYIAPKTMIAMAQIYRDDFNDTLTYDSLLNEMLEKYPHSDFVPDALDLLGLMDTPADTGYALKYYHKAEDFIYDDFNFDSAYYYMSYVADSFPMSKYSEKAGFARLWLKEEYKGVESEEDSSLYFAFADFADMYGDSEYGKEAEKILVAKPKQAAAEEEYDEIPIDSTTGQFAVQDIEGTEDSTMGGQFTSIEQRCSTGPDGNTIFEVQTQPRKFNREFIYPPAAYTLRFEGYLCFQIKLDNFGYVTDYILVTPTESQELNNEASAVVEEAEFDTYWIQPEYADQYFLYKFKIELPASLR